MLYLLKGLLFYITENLIIFLHYFKIVCILFHIYLLFLYFKIFCIYICIF